MKVLKLTVHRKAFEVMVTGEKTEEYRKPSQWIKSRLWEKVAEFQGIPVYKPREYDLIEIRNGYGKSRPVFTAKFIDFLENVHPFQMKYSNGLIVDIEPIDHIIRLGKIIKIENYELDKR